MQAHWSFPADGLKGPVIHVGPGLNPACPPELSRLWLVEPDADMRAGWQETLEAGGAHVMAAALGTEAGGADLRVMNFPELSAIVAPVGLGDVFPGAEEVARHRVETIAPDGLVSWLGKEALPEAETTDPDALLILETPGLTAAILRAADAGGVLDRIGHVAIRCFRQPLYAGDPGAGELPELMDALGYGPLHEGPGNDREWFEAVFVREPVRLVLRETRARLASERARVAALETGAAEAAGLRQQIGALESALAASDPTGAIAAALERATQAETRADLLARDLAELQTRHAALQSETEALETLLSEVAADLRQIGKMDRRRVREA